MDHVSEKTLALIEAAEEPKTDSKPGSRDRNRFLSTSPRPERPLSGTKKLGVDTKDLLSDPFATFLKMNAQSEKKEQARSERAS